MTVGIFTALVFPVLLLVLICVLRPEEKKRKIANSLDSLSV